jgi:peptidyl-tRNA hydrolase
VSDDPYRMFLVLRRGAIEDLSRAGELAGAAAVGCVMNPEWAEAVAAWRARPGKVCLRARNPAQWDRVLDEEAYAIAGDPEGEAVLALPPRRRSERGPLLSKLQAMSSELEPPPSRVAPDPDGLTYVVNPQYEMSSGKTIAQIAHAAVMAAERGGLEEWIVAGCPARVVRPSLPVFAALCERDDLAARVVDAGLTEVPPGTVTVLALAPGANMTPAS